MPTGTATKKLWIKWSLFAGFWTLIGLSFASQFYISSYKAGSFVTWRQAVGYALGDWYVFAVLSIPVIHWARRFRFEGRAWALSLIVHLMGSILFSLSYMVLRAGLGMGQSFLGGVPVPFPEAFRPLLVKTWHFNLLIYWVIVSVGHAFDYYRRYQEREFRAAELEKHLAQAKLQALQMQLNPHFLFNTLHAISSLMHQDVEAADRMISRLSELLRTTLESTDTQEVTLREELDFLERYLEIEKTRFGKRLTVRMEIAPDTLEAQVPNLVLQPLVENAIRHGIEPHAKPGEIELRACRSEGRLLLQVRDNGAGLPSNHPPEEGVGLANTRARLQQLYGSAHRLDFTNVREGGLLVTVSLPFRLANQGAPVAT